MKHFLIYIILITTWNLFPVHAVNKISKSSIHNIDFKSYLLKTSEFLECLVDGKDPCAGKSDTENCSPAITISVAYADLTGDQNGEAIVQGSSCMTGTAGPDIHKVYQIQPDGKVHELTIPGVDKKYYNVLLGNINYNLFAENGKLLATYTDTSDREKPLVIKYKWVEDQFRVESVEAAPTFRTSYDCTKTTADQERAVCYVKNLADLDIKLNDLYKKVLATTTESKKMNFVKEQRDWIAKRNKTCTIYKWWVDCLHKAYQTRIDALKKKLSSK